MNVLAMVRKEFNVDDGRIYLMGHSLGGGGGLQQLAEQLKGLGFPCDYKLLPGLDHGGIIGGSMPDVFAFFTAHTKSK